MIYLIILFFWISSTSHISAMDSGPDALIKRALDLQATDTQLELAFKELDSHPQTELIRQKLIDENKQVWWSMAMNLNDTVHENKEAPMIVTLKEMTNTAQFYHLDSHLHSIDITRNGAPIGALVTNQRFCISDPKQIESLKLYKENGGKIVAIKQLEANTLCVFQTDKITLRDSQHNLMPNILNISNLKKMVVSHNGKWIFVTFYNTEPKLIHIDESNHIKRVLSVPSLANKKITFTIDDNNEYGILATPNEANVFKITPAELLCRTLPNSSGVHCVDITYYGTFGLIASEKLVQRIEPKILFETDHCPTINIPTEHVTNARLSCCGSYVFTTHSDGKVSIWNLHNKAFLTRVFPNETLTKIALNPTGSSLVFGGQSCLGRITISPILEKLRTSSLSNIATLIQVWQRKDEIKKCAFLKNRFLTMPFPNRRKLLSLAKLTLEEAKLSERPICYDEIADSTTPCKHAFCSSCLEQQQNKLCPMCRAPLSSKP